MTVTMSVVGAEQKVVVVTAYHQIGGGGQCLPPDSKVLQSQRDLKTLATTSVPELNLVQKGKSLHYPHLAFTRLIWGAPKLGNTKSEQ